MMPDAVRSIAASPNCPIGTGFGRPNGLASAVVLMADSATMPACSGRSRPCRSRCGSRDGGRCAAFEQVVDQQVAHRAVERLRPRRDQVRLRQLVDLEVEVRRPGLVVPRPAEVQERLPVGPVLAGQGTALQVGLPVGDRPESPP